MYLCVRSAPRHTGILVRWDVARSASSTAQGVPGSASRLKRHARIVGSVSADHDGERSIRDTVAEPRVEAAVRLTPERQGEDGEPHGRERDQEGGQPEERTQSVPYGPGSNLGESRLDLRFDRGRARRAAGAVREPRHPPVAGPAATAHGPRDHVRRRGDGGAPRPRATRDRTLGPGREERHCRELRQGGPGRALGRCGRPRSGRSARPSLATVTRPARDRQPPPTRRVRQGRRPETLRGHAVSEASERRPTAPPCP